jgi:acetylornithine deacetylase/succinyl-diaminopimelate desuccinylase-like protein
MPDTVAACLDTLITRQRADQIEFLRDLIRTRSANPFTPEQSDQGEPVERDVAHLIYKRLREIGLQAELQGVSEARPNVLAVLSGTENGPSLILNGHMDTVMPGEQWTRDPFGAEIEGNRLYGLGALDMKASLSLFVSVASVLLEAGLQPRGDLILSFVVDEEPGGCSSFGTAYLLEQGLSATAAIVPEPESTNVTIGHRGGYRFKLTVHGESAHTGLLAWERGEIGRNAIVDMARAVQALGSLALPYDDTPAFPGRVPVVTFPTLIQGGTTINAVPESCTAYGDMRVLPGLDGDQIEALIHERLDSVPNLTYTLERLLFVPAVEIPTDTDIVQILARRTAEVTGQTPTLLGCGPWNDGWMFITRGIPAVCGFGPDGAGVHAPDEYVDLDSLINTTRIFARTIVDYLGIAKE